jgi:hypothetical protein
MVDVADGTEEIDSEAEETVESVDPTFSWLVWIFSFMRMF